MSQFKLLAVLVFLAPILAFAADDSPPPPPISAPLPAEWDARWLDDLRGSDFQTRQQATNRLFEAGSQAVEPLQTAIPRMDHESATRAIEVLDRLSQSPDPATKNAAAGALKSLEESEIPAVASLARSVRVKREERPHLAESSRARGGMLLPRQVRVRGGMQFGMNFMVGGNRTVRLTEPGRKIELSDSNGKNIQLRVTETVDGKETVTEYTAKDAEELATKHPEALPIYERLTQRPGGIGLPAAEVPAQPAVPGFLQDPEAKKKFDAAQEKYMQSIRRRAELRAAGEVDEQARKDLDEARRELRELIQKLQR